jgi:hypothetical protein
MSERMRDAWEYQLVSMGNPLEAGVEERANALGAAGWELAAIDAGVWVFKRPRAEEPAAEGSLRAIVEQTVEQTEPLVEAVAQAPRRAPAGDR